MYPVRICAFKNEKPNYKSILISNINSNITARIFYEKLQYFGIISSAKLIIDFESGKSKNYGYISYENDDSIEKCIKNIKSIFEGQTEAKLVDINESGNPLYTKNLPVTFSEDQIRDFFSKYGNVKMVKKLLTNNEFKGACIIAFDDYRSTTAAIVDINMNEIYLTKTRLFANYLNKKNDKINKNDNKTPKYFIFAKMNLSYLNIKKYEYENQIKDDIILDLKMIFLEEYTPSKILINLQSVNALIELSNFNDINKFKEGLKNVIEKLTFNYQQVTLENFQNNSNLLNLQQMKMLTDNFIFLHNNIDEKQENQNHIQYQNKNINTNLYMNQYSNQIPINYNNQVFNNQNNRLNMLNQGNSKFNINNEYNNNMMNNNQRNMLMSNEFTFNKNNINNHILGSKLIPGLKDTSYGNINHIERNNNCFIPNRNDYINDNNGINNGYNQYPNFNNGYENFQNTGNFINFNNKFNNTNNDFYNYNQNFNQMEMLNSKFNNMNMKNGYYPSNTDYKNLNYSDINTNLTKFQSKIEENENLILSDESRDIESVYSKNYKIFTTEELANEIYDVANELYPYCSDKITGMIKDLGDNEMRKFLCNNNKLKELIHHAYSVRFYY